MQSQENHNASARKNQNEIEIDEILIILYVYVYDPNGKRKSGSHKIINLIWLFMHILNSWFVYKTLQLFFFIRLFLF